MALLFVFGRLETEDRGDCVVILRKKVAGLSGLALARFVSRAGQAAGLQGEVDVLVTSSRELQELNRRFRSKDAPTDVLSFPATDSIANGFSGDVAISAEIATQNARRMGHSAAEEIKILTLHGVLHLAGYDHERDHGKMARKENRLRKALGLPVALIERVEQPSRNRADSGRRKRAGERQR